MGPRVEDLVTSHALRRIGATLCGRYRIHRLIGVGGMGAVYAGRHRNGHPVAIKVLHERWGATPELEKQFRREAQLANTVNHPAIVPVTDDDVSEDGCVFLVMPLLQGESVRARWERSTRRLPVEEVFSIAHAVLGALAAAHAAKIVHRDIKPDNLFLTPDGVRILDFGIARLFQVSDPASATQSGRAVGTPAFMAPEQALGRSRDFDGRTDLWALGATIFTLLTGRLVHEGQTASEILVAAGTRPAPPLEQLAPDTPAAIRAIVDRALSFDRAARWPDAESMDRELLAAFASAYGKAPPDPPRPAVTDSAVDQGLPNSPWPTNPPVVAAPPGSGARPDTERLPAGTTRTTPGSAAPAREGKRARGIAAVALGIGAAALIASTAIVGARRRAASSPVTSSTHDAGVGAPVTSDSRALQAYDRGIALWHAASPADAARSFEEATRIDAGLAAAHLYIALISASVWTETRSHFARAVDHRNRLSPFQSAVLDAMAPAMTEHADWATAVDRLVELQSRFPLETELQLALAHRLRLLFRPQRALAAVEGADSRVPLVWSLRANAYVELDRLEDARAAFDRCLELSPASTSCLQMLLQLEAFEGNCARTEALARNLIAGAPDSPSGYEFLAGSIYGSTRSADVTSAALEQRWARIRPEYRDFSRSDDRFKLAVLEGDPAAADRALDDAEQAVAASPDFDEHGIIAYDRMQLARALGDGARVVALAHRYLALSKAWNPSNMFDLRIATSSLLYRVGGLTRSDYRIERDAWIRAPREALQWAHVPSFQWVEAYASATKDRDDAIDALRHLPEEHPFWVANLRFPGQDEMAGRTFFFAGQFVEAKKHLTRASSPCTIDQPVEQIEAALELGVVNERLGDREGACQNYRDVVRRWGHDARWSAGRAARSALSRLGCDRYPSTLQERE